MVFLRKPVILTIRANEWSARPIIKLLHVTEWPPLSRVPALSSNSNTRHDPPGKRNEGRLRNSCKRTVDNDASKAGYTWKKIEKLAQNRRRWRAVSMDLFSGSERGKAMLNSMRED